jgi:diamine N-acetyltransferase
MERFLLLILKKLYFNNSKKMIEFVQIDNKSISIVRSLAFEIFPITYIEILTSAQIDYMLEMMYSIDSLEKQFENGAKFFLFYFDKKAIGYGSINIENEIGLLNKIYIDAQYHGNGFGKKFLNFMESVALENGASSIQLFVNRYNKAKLFYENQGYLIIKTLDNDIGNGYFMNDYLMEKKILPSL